MTPRPSVGRTNRGGRDLESRVGLVRVDEVNWETVWTKPREQDRERRDGWDRGCVSLRLGPKSRNRTETRWGRVTETWV